MPKNLPDEHFTFDFEYLPNGDITNWDGLISYVNIFTVIYTKGLDSSQQKSKYGNKSTAVNIFDLQRQNIIKSADDGAR